MVIKEEHGADIVGEDHIDHVKQDLQLLVYLSDPFQLQLIEPHFVSLKVSPSHFHVLHYWPTLNPRNPANMSALRLQLLVHDWTSLASSGPPYTYIAHWQMCTYAPAICQMLTCISFLFGSLLELLPG